MTQPVGFYFGLFGLILRSVEMPKWAKLSRQAVSQARVVRKSEIKGIETWVTTQQVDGSRAWRTA